MLWLALVANAVEIESFALTADDNVHDVVRVGDVDQDGFDDVVLRTDGGPVWVPGGPWGPDVSGATPLRGLQGRALTRDDDVAGVGDQNGDGYPDLLVTQIGHPENGAVLLIAGSKDGPGASPWRHATSVPARVVRALGDLNGDGITDFGAWTPKGLFVYRGGATRFIHAGFVPTVGIPRDLGTFDDLTGSPGDLLLFSRSDPAPGKWPTSDVHKAERTGTWTWATPRVDLSVPWFPFDHRALSTDGRYSVGLLTGSDRAHTWHTGFAGLVYAYHTGCFQEGCGVDVAVFADGVDRRVLVKTNRGLHLLEPSGPGEILGSVDGMEIENVGDVDGDGVADLASWWLDSNAWHFVSGGQLGLW